MLWIIHFSPGEYWITIATTLSIEKLKSMNTKYVPALRYGFLTRFYDFLLSLTFPEKKIKRALIKQCAFEGAEDVLDLGVGTATLSIMIKQSFPCIGITGIDVDKKILELAARKIRIEKVLNIKLMQYDGFEIPFGDGCIDKVVSSLVFHHLSTQTKKVVLSEVHRVLRPGGELHIADFGKSANFYTKLAFAVFRRFDGEENTRVNSKGLLPQFILNAGFRYVKQTVHFNTAFGTVTLLKAKK